MKEEDIKYIMDTLCDIKMDQDCQEGKDKEDVEYVKDSFDVIYTKLNRILSDIRIFSYVFGAIGVLRSVNDYPIQ